MNNNEVAYSKWWQKLLIILIAICLVLSSYATEAIANSDSVGSEVVYDNTLITRPASALTVDNNSMLEQGLIPDVKSPFINPIQILVNQLYQKIFGPGQKFFESKISEALNWILGIDPEDTRSDEKKFEAIQKSVEHVESTVKACQQTTIDTLNGIKLDISKGDIIKALQQATLLFDEKYKSVEICTIDDNIKSYNTAKKEGNKEAMELALKKIADVYGAKEMQFDKTNALCKSYDDLHKLLLQIGGSSSLDNLYDNLLNSSYDTDKLFESFNSLYYPTLSLLEKINDYQVISLVALREHDAMCAPANKLAKDFSDQEISNRINAVKGRIGGVLSDLESLNTRASKIPTLTLTVVFDTGKMETQRYHSLSNAWIEAQKDHVVEAKITLYSDFVYNGETVNYFGNTIKYENQNMKFDLPTSMLQYGDESDGYFKNGNLNVKSGKKIQLDLNSFTIANLKSDKPTITVNNNATLNLFTAVSAFDDVDFKKGQIGSVVYEKDSCGSVQNVVFSDSYNFSKVTAEKVRPKNDDQLNNPNYKFEYKTYKNANGVSRKSAALINNGAIKNFEVDGCDFINLTNNGDSNAACISINTLNNFIEVNSEGKTTSTCAPVKVKECSFIKCKAKSNTAISTTKHLNVIHSNFDNCESKTSGGAITKYCIEKDSDRMYDDEKVKTFDNVDCTFTNCNFTNNKAKDKGGALFILGEVVTHDCKFSNNSAAQGGAINEIVRQDISFKATGAATVFDFYDNTVLTNTVFTENKTLKSGLYNYSGGAVYTEGGRLKVNGCSFTSNHSAYDGGAIYQTEWRGVKFWDQPAVINDSTFTSNRAEHDGGAVSCYERPKFNKIVAKDNYAANNGGAIKVEERGARFEEVTITNNTCKNGRGAGVYATKEIFLHKNVVINYNFLQSSDASNLRMTNLKYECISPEWGFYQGGSDLGIDLQGQSNRITDKKTKTSNKDWVDRINAAKNYMHVDDGREVVVDTWGTLFWQRWWLCAR